MIRLPECPICGKTVAPATDPQSTFAPFCSRRCKEVDLFRWCEGRYAIVEPLDPARLHAATENPSAMDDDEFDLPE